MLDVVRETIGHFETIERGELMQIVLDAKTQELSSLSSQLAEKRAQLAELEIRHRSKAHIIDYDAARTLADVHRELAAKRAEFNSIQGERK